MLFRRCFGAPITEARSVNKIGFMLRINACVSAEGAKRYYSESHYVEGKNTRLDYYKEKSEFMGLWGGKAAHKMGLSDGIRKADFDALCDNKRPDKGETLTGRTNDNRRVGYDFTFNASKSVSIAHAFGKEEEKREILDAFQKSVRSTMLEVEKNMLARVRKKNDNYDRETGNIAYGEFTHYTTRPVKGIPYPHLHIHCFVFNGTYDEKDKKWKAGQFGQIKKDASYYQAYFHSKLAKNLQDVGYAVRRTKDGVEMEGVNKGLIDKFSKRTKEINEHALKHGIIDAKSKANIGSKTRASKKGAVSEREQLIEWKKRFSIQEIEQVRNLKKENLSPENRENKKYAKQAVEDSINHHLERKSVVSDKEILAFALKRSIGESEPENVIAAFKERADVISVKEGNQILITTKEALSEEKKLITHANSYRGKFKPLNKDYIFQNEVLNKEQKRAIQHALSTKDGLIIISGKAGTGKTTLMKEVKAGIQLSGKKIFSFAPSADASRNVQRSEGFADADTVASLIGNKDKHSQLKNQVLWIDEAGQLSNKDMNKLFEIAKEQNARIMLSGDIRQHNSVNRGDALRVIQKYSAVKAITVNKIQRQKNKEYRGAVKLLSNGNVEKGLNKLDQIGSVHEIERNNERVKAIANDYMESAYKGKISKNVLVVAPTHKEGERITKQIRYQLKNEGRLAREDREFKILKKVQLTEVEKKDIDNYKVGQVLSFHKNMKGVRAGSHLAIKEIHNNSIIANDRQGNHSIISLDNSDRFSVYEKVKIYLTEKDKVRITGNSKSLEGKRLYNGSTYEVKGFDEAGNIKLSNGSVISKNYGHFNQGYVVTSHSSQGKTADKVIISQSSNSIKASSMEQFYVSVSRGRNAVSIYTDNKQDLLRGIKQTTHKLSAMELTGKTSMFSMVLKNNRSKMLKDLKQKVGLRIENAKAKIKANELPRKNITRAVRTR